MTEHQDASLVQVIHKIRKQYPRSYETNVFLLFALLNHGPVSRTQLVNLTGLSRSTARDGLERLEILDLVKIQKPEINNYGRKQVYWDVNECLSLLRN